MQSLQWNTSDERSQKIVADGCDAHKINTTASMASGTSKHTNNLNPNLGKSLMLLHDWLVKFVNFKAYQDELNGVRKSTDERRQLEFRSLLLLNGIHLLMKLRVQMQTSLIWILPFAVALLPGAATRKYEPSKIVKREVLQK